MSCVDFILLKPSSCGKKGGGQNSGLGELIKRETVKTYQENTCDIGLFHHLEISEEVVFMS